jgi:pantetheine-phosphate adenylyltransferase
MDNRRALYAGSFDPPTHGHMWVIEEGARLFDELIVVVGQNPLKPAGRPLPERVTLVRECCAHLPHVTVRSFDGRYVAQVAAEQHLHYLLRGVRNATDFAYEQTLRNLNRDLQPGVESVFLMTPRELAEVSSSTVRAMIGFAGWPEMVARFVPPPVLRRLLEEHPCAA